MQAFTQKAERLLKAVLRHTAWRKKMNSLAILRCWFSTFQWFLASLRVSCSEYEGQEGIRAFFDRILVCITNMGTPGPSLHTVYWLCDTLKKREVYTSKYCVGDEYRVLLHACGWYVHIQPTNTFTQHNYMMCTAVSFLKWIADY